MKTTIYFIRHSEPYGRDKINNINNTDQFELAYSKAILSFNGEDKALKLSKNDELKNIDYLVSSNTARTMQTAKYIARENNLILNIDENFNERKFGIKNDEKLPDNFGNLQKENAEFKMPNGESQNDVVKRMKNSLEKILEEQKGKRIAIVSHATALTFLFISYGKYENGNVIVKDKILIDKNYKWNAPEAFKAIFNDNQLISIENILRDEL